MRRTSWSLFVVALGLVVFNHQPSAQAYPSRDLQLLLLNGDFETGTLAGWSQAGAVGVWSVTSADKHTGNYSAHALLISPMSYTVSTLTSNSYSVAGNQVTSLSFWAKAPQIVNGAKLVVMAEWYNASSIYLGLSGWTVRNAPAPDWTRYEIPITLPAGAAFLRVQLHALAYPGDAIEIYLDDFTSPAVPDPLLFLPLVVRP